MFCSKCGTQMPDDSRFCITCGTDLSVNPDTDNKYVQTVNMPQIPETSAPPPRIKKPMGKKAKAVLIAAGTLVFALVCVIVVLTLIDSDNAARYNAAVENMNAGREAQAKEAFTALGEYRASSELAKTCQDIMDFDAAQAKLDAGDLPGAKQAFAMLGDYQGAADKATECQNKMDYNAAAAAKDAGNTEDALNAFLKLGEYSDSAALAKECRKKIDFNAAKALMDAKDYNGAMQAFMDIYDYGDSAKLAAECQNIIYYNDANTAYGKGIYYTAYTLYKKASGYFDADTRAKACIQKIPATGELYRNKKYSAKKCPLTIKTSGEGYIYIKIYSSDNVLVSTIFITAGKTTKVKIPAGTYKIKEARGKVWYGEMEMFGDDGYYEVMLFANNAETTKLKSNYIYTLTLGGAKNANIGSRNEDRNAF